MTIVVFVAAALLLAVERLTYAWVWRHPEQFEFLCERYGRGMEPVDGLQHLFRVFKAVQIGVFVGWCLWWDGGRLELPAAAPFVAALVLLAVGQFLNVAVFYRLGPVGVFYGARFGRAVSWCTAFPFSVMRHPQYVGAVLSIWGFFLLLRYPEPDWVALPLLETAYYALGARFEGDESQWKRKASAPSRASCPSEVTPSWKSCGGARQR